MQGIMFTAGNTLANINGTKTRTSRTKGLKKINENPDEWTLEYEELGTYYFVPKDKHCIATMVKCPFGEVGSELYGKETYCPKVSQHGRCCAYRADSKYQCGKDCPPDINKVTKWKSPMMMPETASRYHIILNKIICQRIQDISHKDITAEGLGDGYTEIGWNYAFGQLWNSINEKRGYSWAFNPWVWGLYYTVKLKDITQDIILDIRIKI